LALASATFFLLILATSPDISINVAPFDESYDGRLNSSKVDEADATCTDSPNPRRVEAATPANRFCFFALRAVHLFEDDGVTTKAIASPAHDAESIRAETAVEIFIAAVAIVAGYWTYHGSDRKCCS
jgi:hypothetical protein